MQPYFDPTRKNGRHRKTNKKQKKEGNLNKK
jgi:hypothetical protein